jgi:hypothetical protein
MKTTFICLAIALLLRAAFELVPVRAMAFVALILFIYGVAAFAFAVFYFAVSIRPVRRSLERRRKSKIV